MHNGNSLWNEQNLQMRQNSSKIWFNVNQPDVNVNITKLDRLAISLYTHTHLCSLGQKDSNFALEHMSWYKLLASTYKNAIQFELIFWSMAEWKRSSKFPRKKGNSIVLAGFRPYNVVWKLMVKKKEYNWAHFNAQVILFLSRIIEFHQTRRRQGKL